MKEAASTPLKRGPAFTSQTAKAASAKGLEVRRAQRRERLAMSDTLTGLQETFGGRGGLAAASFEATAQLIEAVTAGGVQTPETPLDALRLAETARITHAIARLEAGESTSNSAHLSARVPDGPVDRGRLLERLDSFRSSIAAEED